MVEAIGLTAGTLTTLSYLPQVIQTFKTRSVKDISLKMYILLALGIATWILYGEAIDSLSVILANIISLALTVAILVMKIIFQPKSIKTSQSRKHYPMHPGKGF